MKLRLALLFRHSSITRRPLDYSRREHGSSDQRIVVQVRDGLFALCSIAGGIFGGGSFAGAD
jgi:hypothetical protein